MTHDADRRLRGAIRMSGYLAGWLLLFTVGMAAFYAPALPDCDDYANVDPAVTPVPDNCQTHPNKLLFFHVPAAFAAYGSFVVLAFSSYRYLARPDRSWDGTATAAAEVGVLFSAATLVSGSLWGHLEWGGFQYWDNDDPKLLLTLIMFLVYVGYLILRKQIDDTRKRGRAAAVYGILGIATIPLSYAAQRIWRSSIHPTVFRPGDERAGIVTEGWSETFLVATFAFLALAAFLIAVRLRLLIDAYDDPGGDA